MGIIANITGLLIVSSMLSTACPQEMFITNKMQSESKIKIVDKSITKNLNYLKLDINMPQLVGGNDEKRINLINNVINQDILPKAEESEKTAKEYFGEKGQETQDFHMKFIQDTQPQKIIIKFLAYIMTIMSFLVELMV